MDIKFILLRNAGYAEHFRGGHGLEIGAFEHPAQLPQGCKTKYVDKFQPEDARAGFPELDLSGLVRIDHIIDLNTEGLGPIPDASQDYVVFNHVIEHVANPIRLVKEVFRVVKPGGLVALGAPDKWYTFDKHRMITPWDHVLDEYRAGVTEVTDAHYIDFLANVHPEELTRGIDCLTERLVRCRLRVEHVHVWDSLSFRRFLKNSFELLRIETEKLYEVMSDRNQFEYFGIFRKI